jgi:hypothetical protein
MVLTERQSLSPAKTSYRFTQQQEDSSMINVPATAQLLSNDYSALGNWIGLATDDPGGTNAPANEVAVDGYARQQTTWTPGDAGVNQGSPVTFNLPDGTYPYLILCSDATGDNMFDNCKMNNVVLNQPGQIVVIPQYTQT